MPSELDYETAAFNAVTEYCSAQPLGSSPRGLMMFHRMAIARAVLSSIAQVNAKAMAGFDDETIAELQATLPKPDH